MSVGLGILLGCTFIGTILLYLNTRDSWSWKKIGRRSLVSIGVLMSIMVLVVLGFFLYERWTERPQLITSLEDVSLGEKLSDVIFRHGAFVKMDRGGKYAQKYPDVEGYGQEEKRLVVEVQNERVTGIYYYCKADTDYTRLNRIACEDSGDAIKERFGNRIRVLCSAQAGEGSEFKRVSDVVEYGTRYFLQRKVVSRLMWKIENGVLPAPERDRG